MNRTGRSDRGGCGHGSQRTRALRELAAAETAAGRRTGTFRMYLLDKMSLLDDGTLERGKKLRFDRRQLLIYAVTDKAWTGKLSLKEAGGGGVKRRRNHGSAQEKELDKGNFEEVENGLGHPQNHRRI